MVTYFPFTIRDNSPGNNGVRKTGLTPTVSLLKKVPVFTNIATNTVTITEVGQGWYVAAYDPEANGEACCQIDAGASLVVEADRYIDLFFSRDAGRIAYAGADAAGKRDNSVADTEKLYDLDGTTVLKQWTLTPSGGPYSTKTPTTPG